MSATILPDIRYRIGIPRMPLHIPHERPQNAD